MKHFLFVAIEVPTSAVHGLVIVASAEMNDGVRHSTFGVADVNINRSIRLLAETNFLPLRSMPLPSKDCRKATAWSH